MPEPLSFEKRQEIYEFCKANPELSNRKAAAHLGVSDVSVLTHRQNAPKREPDIVKPEPIEEVDQLVHLRARVAEQSRAITGLRKAIGEQKETRDAIIAAIEAVEPYKHVPYKNPPKPGSPIVPVLKLSDWHIGEVINPHETEGFGRYDWETAQRRMLYITDKFIEWVNVMRNGYRIDQIRVWREGDLVSGNIHKELEITNEFPAPVATAKAGFLLSEVVSRIAAHAKEVIVEGVDSDNHGRLNPKPQAKQKAQNNWCYLSAVIAQEALKKHGNVDFRWTQGMRYLADVNGQRFLIHHGDGIKSALSIPFYGLERDRAREATRRMNTDKTFHYISCAHFHGFSIVGENIIINKCLSGTTEFDHSCGRTSIPGQVGFLVHPKHGVFNLVPFSVN